MTERKDAFGSRRTLATAEGSVDYYSLPVLTEKGVGHIDRLPFSIKVLLESVLRHVDGYVVREYDVNRLANWQAEKPAGDELPFMPARVILQDFTGVPAVVDLAALRDGCRALGGDPNRINPLVPCDLVIDHSVQVDEFGSADALERNMDIEFQRNRERYEFLKWGQQAFDNFGVIPPGVGIIHQVNLEYLAKCVLVRDGVAMPDSLVGTDSHTVMINGLGVVGWGVGGIEAEAVMLGQPIYMLTPEVVGVKLTGELAQGTTATDLVLTVTQKLREVGVVGRFVEFFGPGLETMSLPDRAVIANMAPEYGATMGFCPVDGVTLDYLRMTGRSEQTVDLVERYCKEQGLWHDAGAHPQFTCEVSLDLGQIEPSLAGPKRPQDRITLKGMKRQWHKDLKKVFQVDAPKSVVGQVFESVEHTVESITSQVLDEKTTEQLKKGHGLKVFKNVLGQVGDALIKAARDPMPELARGMDESGVEVTMGGKQFKLDHGAVVIAAITSCTNTSSPALMMTAGLVAKKAVEKGLAVKPWVKTSNAPGSRVVSDYLDAAGLTAYLEQLGFHTVGYGCTTCIGNSGPLPAPIAEAIREKDLVACSVLSGNRNFEGRVNPDVKANYLASPPLVIAYALAGTVDIDLTSEPIGVVKTVAGEQSVYLKDIWPSQAEVQMAVRAHVKPRQFTDRYGQADAGDARWQQVESGSGELYDWPADSTYIQHPPFFQDMTAESPSIGSISDARCLMMLGDSVTTDHISPAGSIPADQPAGRYLQSCGVEPSDFNSFGSRRGNHEVMMRGTFANIRVRNLLAPDTEGGYTTYLPTGEQMYVYDAAMKYQEQGTPLVVLAGKDYGMGSSRDWAAKGTYLLGVRVVIAESYERIHRSNLVGMGVLPLQFKEGEGRSTYNLDGTETFSIELGDDLKPGSELTVKAVDVEGNGQTFKVDCRIDTPVEVEYYRNGGILHTVLRKLAAESGESSED